MWAEVPFRRDAALADDHSGTTKVIRDAVIRLGLPGDTPVCCIHPTALLIGAQGLADVPARLQDGVDWVLALGGLSHADRPGLSHGPRHRPHWRAQARPDAAPQPESGIGLFTTLSRSVGRWPRPGPIRRRGSGRGAAAVVLPLERCIDGDTPDDRALAARLAAALPDTPA